MIFVDLNLFVIDLRYPDDPNYRVNRRALDRLARDESGITSVVNVLELCGMLSFNLSTAALHALYVHFARRYRVTVVPGGDYETRLPNPTVRELLARMEKRMALRDAGSEASLFSSAPRPGHSSSEADWRTPAGGSRRHREPSYAV